MIGADGLHSVTRRLTFGQEGGVVRHMGLYVATTPLGGEAVAGDGRDILMHNTPGRAVAVSPMSAGAFFLYRSPAEPSSTTATASSTSGC